MLSDTAPMPLSEQFAAAQDWWREAGVDQDFSDAVDPFLKDEAEDAAAPDPGNANRAAEPAVPEGPEPLVSAAQLPGDLAGFQTWWASDANPFQRIGASPVPPRGPAAPRLMLIVPMPEAEDSETLLSARQGRFLSNVTRALGIEESAIYFASALPAHMPLPDWRGLARDGLGAVLSRHIALVKPERAIVLGSDLSVLLPDEASALPSGRMLSTYSPDRLLDHAGQRARLWKRLLHWMPPA